MAGEVSGMTSATFATFAGFLQWGIGVPPFQDTSSSSPVKAPAAEDSVSPAELPVFGC